MDDKLRSIVFTEHCDIIVAAVAKAGVPPGKYSIYMYGGYGKGEGGWVDAGKTVKPYNDYDILIVCNIFYQKIFRSKLRDIEMDLLDRIDIKFIDLDVVSELKFWFPRNTIYRSDLFNGSNLLYGRDRLSKYSFLSDSTKISKLDLIGMFYIRSWTICYGLSDEKDEVFRRAQLAKLIFSVVDCKLALDNKYHSSYRERYNRAAKIYAKSELEALAGWALQERLSPGKAYLDDSKLDHMISIAITLFYEEFLKPINSHYRSNFQSITEFFTFRVNANKFPAIILETLLSKRAYAKRNLLIGLGGAWRSGLCFEDDLEGLIETVAVDYGMPANQKAAYYISCVE